VIFHVWSKCFDGVNLVTVKSSIAISSATYGTHLQRFFLEQIEEEC